MTLTRSSKIPKLTYYFKTVYCKFCSISVYKTFNHLLESLFRKNLLKSFITFPCINFGSPNRQSSVTEDYNTNNLNISQVKYFLQLHKFKFYTVNIRQIYYQIQFVQKLHLELLIYIDFKIFFKHKFIFNLSVSRISRLREIYIVYA